MRMPLTFPNMPHQKMRVAGFYSFALLFINVLSVSAQCVEEHKDLLLELKKDLQFEDISLATTVTLWNGTGDCCQWGGVQCDLRSGRVVGLDLSSQYISGGIDGLFKFESLESLNLAYNLLDSHIFPSDFGKLTNLSYLNLSLSGFYGQIPLEFASLTRLVVLDVSSFMVSVEKPDLGTLIHNLSRLRELHLDYVNVSVNGYHWCNAVSSLPNLRVLSMANAALTGPFVSSLAKLQSLEIIRLSGNNLSSPFPKFFADLSNLKELSLSSCDLSGTVPSRLFQISSLQRVDLDYNQALKGSFPEFPINSSLQTLSLPRTSFSGTLPKSLANLKMLSTIRLEGCNFSGALPDSFINLTELMYCDLSNNSFSGQVPSFNSLRTLWHLNLARNALAGKMPGSLWEGLEQLAYLYLNDNVLEDEIPASIFALPSLTELYLSNNRFSGSIRGLGSMRTSFLRHADLSSNHLEDIPEFRFELKNLTFLSLAWNKFHGSLDLTKFQKLTQINNLDLSHNNFSEHVTENVSLFMLLPRLSELHLAACNLQKVPNLRNHSSMSALDLSDNNIHGEIPSWMWEMPLIVSVNLSVNQFTGFQEPYDLNSTRIYRLDLHSNMLRGRVPLPPHSSQFLDFSSNMFSSYLPPNISSSLGEILVFSIANNNVKGTIPDDFWCNSRFFALLDMSNNSLQGRIPSCLFPEELQVLNLRRNNLSGEIPDAFPQVNCDLQTLDFSGNQLQGKLPSSLSTCSNIEVLNLGDNNLTGMFPCFNNLSQLRVLALRSNSFYGNISCLDVNSTKPNLQIVDLSSNNFDGVLSEKLFQNLKAAMTVHAQPQQQQLQHLHRDLFGSGHSYYQDSVTFIHKGTEVELVKIYTIFTTIDFSNNNFQGVVPDTLGGLDSLRGLNLSHNSLSGHIPASMGTMGALESLDLSSNDLDGEIPEELASLTFLSVLNLSYNHLTGRIPQGTQMQTFNGSSYLGNAGLCGFPVERNCTDHVVLPDQENESPDTTSSSFDMNEIFISAEVGFFVAFGVILVPLLFSERWRALIYNKHMDRIIFFILRRMGKVPAADPRIRTGGS